MKGVKTGEMVEFSSGLKDLTLNFETDSVGVVIFMNDRAIVRETAPRTLAPPLMFQSTSLSAPRRTSHEWNGVKAAPTGRQHQNGLTWSCQCWLRRRSQSSYVCKNLFSLREKRLYADENLRHWAD